MEKNIYEQIKKEEKEFEETRIELVPGCFFNQKETIRKILLYYNSRFETGDKDSEGFKKHFYNVVEAPCHIASKAIDLDTKDIIVTASEPQWYYHAWLFAKDLRNWLKEKEFGKLLNDIVRFLPIFGSVVVKIVRGNPYLVDLRHFIVEQDAESLDKANYIIEKHYWTLPEFLNMEWDDEIKAKVFNEFKKQNKKFITVYERYGWVPAEWVNESGSFVRAKFIVADLGDGIVLSSEKIDSLPYKECHWEKIPGRWLGMGQVEKLFEIQVRINELVNLKAKGLYWSSLHIYQTRDQAISRNSLLDAKNGDILYVESEITPIVNEERNLVAFSQEEARWDRLRDERTFSYDVIRGERLPAGTPLGAAQLAAYMTGSYFDQKRENIGLFLKSLLYDVLIPQMMEEASESDRIIRFAADDEDIEKLDALIANQLLHEKIMSFIRQNGYLPSVQEVDFFKRVISQRLKERKEKYVRIPKGFYKDLKYKIDIVITGEQIDLQSKRVTLQTALNILASNPTILENPQTKKIFMELLNLSGISPISFVEEETPTIENAPLPERGGSLPRISTPPPAVEVTPETLPL